MRRISISLATLCGALLALALPSSSFAVGTSQITTPTGPTTNVYGEEGSKLLVAGTANFTEVDIRCYYEPERYLSLGGPIVVKGGAFSTEVNEFETGFDSPCQLRAVPPSTSGPFPPGEETPYSGPLVYFSQFEAGKGSDFFGASATPGGTFTFEEAGNYGLESHIFSPAAHADQRLFYGDQNLGPFSRPASAGTPLKVDGATALLPNGAREVEARLEEEAAELKEPFTPPSGKPSVTTTKSFNETTRQLAVTEQAPVVECSPSSAIPATLKSCTSFVSAGVTLTRSYSSAEEDHQALASDTWRSTDGKTHTVAANYVMEQYNFGKSSYLFPGAAAFAETVKGETKTVPAGPGEVLYKSHSGLSEAGNGENPQGAIVWDAAPSEPIKVIIGTNEGGPPGTDLGMQYNRTVPAGGATPTLRIGYAQSFSMTETRAFAQSLLASFNPTVSIASPANGATIVSTAASTTVTGTAGDGVAVSSVTVNGVAATIGTGGAWSATVPLSPGSNTITAVATNQSGLSSSASAGVTFKFAPAVAKQVGSASGAKGKVTFKVSCTGAAGETCTVHAALTTVEKLRGSHLLGIAARGRRHNRTITVGAITLVIPAGQSVSVTVGLNSTGRKLLARFHKLPVHLLATLEPEAHHLTTVISQNLTIKPARRRHKHH